MAKTFNKAIQVAIPRILGSVRRILDSSSSPLRVTQVFKKLPENVKLVSLNTFKAICLSNNITHKNLITTVKGSDAEIKPILAAIKGVLDSVDQEVNCVELHDLLPEEVQRSVSKSRLYTLLRDKKHINLKRGLKVIPIEDRIRKYQAQHVNHLGKPKYKYPSDYNDDGTLDITCPVLGHGTFNQSPHSHGQGSGCPKCSAKAPKTTATFVKESVAIHSDLITGKPIYSYESTKYVRLSSKVAIVCRIHGKFYQTPAAHLKGHGCAKCSKSCLKSTEQFILEASRIHVCGDKPCYDYSSTLYKHSQSRVDITCKTHGVFSQLAYLHLQGSGCPKCNKTRYNVILKGKSFWLDSKAEEFALNQIVNRGIDVKDILVKGDVGWKPIPYTFKGKRHEYWPDFYLPKYNRVIEIKSTSTLGLHTYKDSLDPQALYDKTVAKAKACVEKAGLNFTLMLIFRSNRNQVRIHVPNNWYTMKRPELVKLLKRKPARKCGSLIHD